MRFSVLLISAVCLSGCCQKKPGTPSLRPVVKISARVHAVPDLLIGAIDCVEVPEGEMSAFAKLITPTEPCGQAIDSTMHHHVADVFLQHKDGSTTTLIVRWTGHNPAAISLDDHSYYYGGSDDFPDGATRIVRLLHKYHHRSRK